MTVTTEQAQALKLLGYGKECMDSYSTIEGILVIDEDLGRYDYNGTKLDDLAPYASYYSAPSISDALEWCMEKYGVWGGVYPQIYTREMYPEIVIMTSSGWEEKELDIANSESYPETLTALMTAVLIECEKIMKDAN